MININLPQSYASVLDIKSVFTIRLDYSYSLLKKEDVFQILNKWFAMGALLKNTLKGASQEYFWIKTLEKVF